MHICRYNYPVCISVKVIAYMHKLGVQFHLHFKHECIWLNSHKIRLKILNQSFMRDIIDLIKTWRIRVMESSWKFPLWYLQIFIGLKKHSLIIFTYAKILFILWSKQVCFSIFRAVPLISMQYCGESHGQN